MGPPPSRLPAAPSPGTSIAAPSLAISASIVPAGDPPADGVGRLRPELIPVVPYPLQARRGPVVLIGRNRRLAMSWRNSSSFVVPANTHVRGWSVVTLPYASRYRSSCRVMKDLVTSMLDRLTRRQLAQLDDQPALQQLAGHLVVVEVAGERIGEPLGLRRQGHQALTLAVPLVRRSAPARNRPCSPGRAPGTRPGA